MRCISLILFLFLSVASFAQNFTVSGYVTDKKNGETLIGVTVFPLELRSIGASCNEYGFYSLTLPEGKYHIVYSLVGYKADTTFIQLNANIKSNRFLSENVLTT